MSLNYPRKLVRDRVPETIRANGQEPIITTPIDDVNFLELLLSKLREEADELDEATQSEVAVATEIADILEVLRALADFCDVEWERVERVRRGKHATTGGFTRRLVWHGNQGGAV